MGCVVANLARNLYMAGKAIYKTYTHRFMVRAIQQSCWRINNLNDGCAMKKYMLFILATAATTMSSAGYAQTASQGVSVDANTKAEVTTNAEEIAKSKKGIAKQNANIETNRKEKAEAKAKGDLLDQASQSVQIGVNKTARGMAEINHDVHVKMKKEGVSNVPKD
jgi:hypothetical protein